MKAMRKVIVALTTTLLAGQALAVSDSNKTVQSAGVQSPNAYFRVNEALSANCNFNVIYIGDLSTPGARAMYATVLSAQATGKPLTTVAYNVASTGECTATQVEVSS